MLDGIGGVSSVITRTGPSYGSDGRLDELPHKMILYSIKGRGLGLGILTP